MGKQYCDGMTYNVPAPPDAIWGPHTFEFLEPATLTIRRQGGRIERIRFGMSEQIEILQPKTRYCIAGDRQLDTIPMTDGDQIISWPANLRMRMLYGDTL